MRCARFFLILSGLLLSGCMLNNPKMTAAPIPGAVTEFNKWQDRASRIEIIRDDFGVPHIYAKTDADAVFGLLYAQAEDDFPRIEQNYIWAIGRLAEVEGEAALASDIRARLFMTLAEAEAAYAIAPDWLQALCQGFADGLNFYLATHPDVAPKLLTRFEPWMPLFFSEGSIGGDIEQVSLTGIRAFYGLPAVAAVQGPGAGGQALAQVDQFEEPRGSNGIAIAAKLTRHGNPLFLINPHTSFYFRGEAHVVSEEGLNAYGGVTWGQFFIYQGFNERTGWMHTSTRLDFMDEFLEDVSHQAGAWVYRYGDTFKPVTQIQETLSYRVGETQQARTVTLNRTDHGPITGEIEGQWVATAMNWDPVPALMQSVIRTKQQGLAGFRAMLNLRRNSSNNTVYADADDNIAYFHGNFVPRRNPNFDYTKPLPGWNPAADWQGIHALDELVYLINPANGWVQNCNSTPFTAAGSASPDPEDYPVYMAPDAENFRGIHAVGLLDGAQDWTLERLLKAAYDPYLPGFERLIPGLVLALAGVDGLSPEARAAAAELGAWDLSSSVDSIAMTLAHFYGLQYLAAGDRPKGLSDMALINHFGVGSEPSERVQVFTETLQDLTQRYGDWRLPWGEVNRLQRLTGDILQPHDDAQASLAVGFGSGRWGALASFGAKRFAGTQKIYGASGNSFVAVVEFGDKVRAKSLLAGGQSGDPSFPHFFDQANLYAAGRFKEVAYYRSDVLARAQMIYHPGQE